MTISNVPPPEALAAIESGFTRHTRRAEIYMADGETLWIPSNGNTESRLVSGGINVDFNRDERRTIEISLDNDDEMLATNNGDGFWYNKIIKAYRGVRYINPLSTGEPYAHWEIQMGEFMIDKIDDDAKDAQIRVSGRDYTKKCLTSKSTSSMSFEAGTYLYQLIRALAALSGIKKMKIPFTNETLPARIDIERGTERWFVMKQAANSNNYDIYFDNQGFLTMSKFSDPTLSPPVLTFKSGTGGNIITYNKSVNDSRLYNHVAVYGDRESSDGGVVLMPFFGEAKNEDPNSPTSIEQIGDRYYSFASGFFTNDAQCQRYAETLLKIHSLESYEINWSSLYYPHLDVGKVVEVFEPNKDSAEGPTKFLLDTLDLSLDLNPMGATGKRILLSE